MRQILEDSCYKNYCIDHNQILQSNKDPQVLTVGGPKYAPNKSKMVDGCHLKKLKKIPSHQLTIFGTLKCLGPLDPVSQ